MLLRRKDKRFYAWSEDYWEMLQAYIQPPELPFPVISVIDICLRPTAHLTLPRLLWVMPDGLFTDRTVNVWALGIKLREVLFGVSMVNDEFHADFRRIPSVQGRIPGTYYRV